MKMKRAVASILSFVILCTALVFTGSAEGTYLESEHPYENNLSKLYVYNYPEAIDGFFVTFGEDTSFEPEGWDFAPEDFNPDWNFDELREHYKTGDILKVYTDYIEQPCTSEDEYLYEQYNFYDEDRKVAYSFSDYMLYSGKELAGKTLYIEGNTLALRLQSDESITDYGFTVDYIGTQLPEGKPYVRYNIGDNVFYDFFGPNEELIADLFFNLSDAIKPGYVIEGWATQPDGELVYRRNDTIRYEGENIELYPVWTREYYTISYIVDERCIENNFSSYYYFLSDDFEKNMITTALIAWSLGYDTNLLLGWSEQENASVAEYAASGEALEPRDYILYPVWRETSFDRSEMFSFAHSSTNFSNQYTVNDAHYERMMKSAALTFGINPLSYPLGVASLIFHKTFNESETWGGSCCGMAITAALQHEGYIDILSEQNAACVRDLAPTEELISTINYYQAFNIESSLAENQALNVGTPVYRQNIKDLYESAASGKTPMITYFYENDKLSGVAKDLLTGKISTHVVLAIGTFELDEPMYEEFTRALIIYNCNNEYGFEVMYVADDWSKLYYDSYYNSLLGSFKWTDDYSQFKSFDITGDVSPSSWHVAVLMRIFRFFKILLEALLFNS